MELTYKAAKTKILALSQPERAVVLARFFKTGPGQYGEGDHFLGLTMPQQRVVVRQYRHLPISETEQLVQDAYHECRMVGLLIWVYQTQKGGSLQQADILERYVANRQYINNWDLVDVTCPHIVGRHTLTGDRTLLYNLARENDLWSQRMALISTLALIRKGQFADTFALAEMFLPHKHDLIHMILMEIIRFALRSAISLSLMWFDIVVRNSVSTPLLALFFLFFFGFLRGTSADMSEG